MDDLNGLSWSSNSDGPANKPPPMSSGLFPSVRPNGASGRSTPMSATSNRSNSPAKPATSTGDSFANLVSFNSSAANKNLSLLEQQKRLQEEKAKKEAENRSRYEAQYGGQNSQFWDSFEQGRTQSPGVAPPKSQSVSPPAEDDDILAAFNATAPVDASTHFPIPSSNASQTGTNSRQETPNGGIVMQDNTGNIGAFDDDDDDPFGLNNLKPKAPAPAQPQDDEDDFLGLLGKPVSEIPRQQAPPKAEPSFSHDRDEHSASPMPSNEVDRAIAELVDMGFPADKSRQALKTTQSGTDVQAAVGWLLTQAHADSRQKSQSRSPVPDQSNRRMERSTSRQRKAQPPWTREDRSNPSRLREDSRSPGAAEKDPAQIASQLGNNLWKTAGSLWKTGSKKFQQAVNEFNADHDSNNPKWMRDASASREESFAPSQPGRRAEGRHQPQEQPQDLTSEAMLLESGDSRPQKPPRPQDHHQLVSAGALRAVNPPQPPNKCNNQTSSSDHHDQAPQSPSHACHALLQRSSRLKLLGPLVAADSTQPPARATPPTTRPASIPIRPKAPTRPIPPVSAEALQSTHRHRERAAEAYKRGDYAAAHQSFSTALGMLPDQHPITIIVRSNRAMTGLKVGEPKSAIDDADIILNLIGPSRGEDETIDLGNGEPAKPMKDFFGKALMRKAEALEQLERWADAAQAWKLAVESGHGGSNSIQGRNRCERAAGISKPPSKPSAPAKKRPSPAPKKTSALSDLSGASASGQDSEAVSRLREANKAAERADEEKFALSESVDGRIASWKNGKQDNLRALLGSLDTVLWPEAGWKKINLSELVLPNKVKIQYMKGIAKVHPDKISPTATTEQRMIAGAVFGTLNEAWDKFRVENNI
ncbi:hypothetical protein N7462_003780 [Penicillium macrosclerotiorum]|uniref:uncharacterized protein n=1 Tax=Penicillium macrosclerotiorum TaxID=303699 RepID=UPI002548D90A|nr:uncharacterized protein N7462_003780 [Penicillium macrosclerotiorum]KAJ5689388.1 hypothetical protein N7462_003780 [Penicillium macrosclerotiorum]